MLAVALATLWLTSAQALLLGMALALAVGVQVPAPVRKAIPVLLGACVMGLGAGTDLGVVVEAGASGFSLTLCSVVVTLGLGRALGRWLRVDPEVSLLVGAGTAICGGSAIAALGQARGSRPEAMAIALVTVFVLNAVALTVFPVVGQGLSLDERSFGLWAGLAIHDTSSVVGAGLQYGPGALEVGTTVKLVRALWILPLVAVLGASGASVRSGLLAALKRSWFVFGFVALSAVFTGVPELGPVVAPLARATKAGLVLCLFFLGLTVSRAAVRESGPRTFLQGTLLWLATAALTLLALVRNWVQPF